MDKFEPIHGAFVTAIDDILAGDIGALPGAFIWGKSPQGHDYWDAICTGKAPLDDASRSYLIRLRDAVLAREKGE